MLSKNALNQLKRWGITERLIEAIDYMLEHIDKSIDTETYENLLRLKKRYNQLKGSDEDSNAIDTIPFQDYEHLAKSFFRILAQYEIKYPHHSLEEEDLHASNEDSFDFIKKNKRRKEKTINENAQIQGICTHLESISLDSYVFLFKTLVLLSFLIFSLSYLIYLYSFGSIYYDDNWFKVYVFFMGAITFFFILKICSNWILYSPKKYCLYRLKLLDRKGQHIAIWRTEDPYGSNKNNYSWLHIWRLIYPGKKPTWVIHSRLLKWHLPIMEGLRFFLLPSILAIGTLLIFQSHINAEFPVNSPMNFDELTEQNARLKNYSKWTTWGYSVIAKTYQTSGLLVLFLVILSLIGAFLSRIKYFLRHYKQASKILKFLYFFFVTLTAFTYSGSTADNFLEKKQNINNAEIERLKISFNKLVYDAEEQFLKEQIVESIIDNEELEDLIGEVQKHKEESGEKEHEINKKVDKISSINGAIIQKSTFIFKSKYNTGEVLKQHKKFPNKSKPKSPKMGKKSKTIWNEVKGDLNKGKIKNIRENLSKRKQEWNTKIEKKINKKSKPFQNILRKYAGKHSTISGKIITKEAFNQVLGTLSNNDLTKGVFRAIYEKAVDPKVQQHMANRVNAVIKEMPNPKSAEVKTNPILDKELKKIRVEIEREKLKMQKHYKKQVNRLDEIRIDEDRVKREKNKLMAEQKAVVDWRQNIKATMEIEKLMNELLNPESRVCGCR